MLWGLEAYYEAFAELSTDRQSGTSIGPIPWSSIDRYASRYGIEDDAFEYLIRMVRALDDAFLAYCRKKAPEGGTDDGRTSRVQPED
jgi:hypothetical protein